MDVEAFMSTARGEIRRSIHGWDAFHPAPLPRELELPPRTVALLTNATAALYNLGGIGRLLPNPDLLILPYIRAEAVLSSRIEGTESTITDILKVQIQATATVQGGDVREVLNYMRAMNHGLARLQEGMPLCLRLIKEMQDILLSGVRGQPHRTGEFRDEQNWIGPPECRLEDATYVPPPVDHMHQALADWERFLHVQSDELPLLVKVALAHYQFEAIHPFFDGNGRIGRLLIPLALVAEAALSAPLLYLSVYFERRRTTYRHLLTTSQTGDLLPWIEFFLQGVLSQATDAQARTVRLVESQRDLRQRLMDNGAPTSVLVLAESLLVDPYVTSAQAMRIISGSRPTAQKAIDTLVDMDVLVEMTGRQRHRMYFAPTIFEAIYGDFETPQDSQARGSREATQAEA